MQNTFVMCHDADILIQEVDSMTSVYQNTIDMSGRKYDNVINAFIPKAQDPTCPYVSKFMTVTKSDEGNVADIFLNTAFTQTIQLLLLVGGDLFFKDTINGGDLLIKRMEEKGLVFVHNATLHFGDVAETFMQFKRKE
jgi:hypothetical protein